MGTPSNFALRLPASLKQGAEQVAREDGTTLNQFIVSAVAEKLSAMRTAQYFEERAQRGDLQAALALLGRAGGLPPSKKIACLVRAERPMQQLALTSPQSPLHTGPMSFALSQPRTPRFDLAAHQFGGVFAHVCAVVTLVMTHTQPPSSA